MVVEEKVNKLEVAVGKLETKIDVKFSSLDEKMGRILVHLEKLEKTQEDVVILKQKFSDLKSSMDNEHKQIYRELGKIETNVSDNRKDINMSLKEKVWHEYGKPATGTGLILVVWQVIQKFLM